MILNSNRHLFLQSLNSDLNSSTSKRDKELTPLDIYDSDENNSHYNYLLKLLSNTTDFSRIISGVIDDIQQESEFNDAKSVYDANEIIMKRLSRTCSQHSKSYNKEGINTEGEEGSVSEDLDNLFPPDKGYAWVIAVAATSAIFATWGANSGYGVFLNYYLDNDVFEGATEFDYALIGGIVTFLAQFLAPVSLILCNIFGFRVVGFCGLTIQTIGYMVASVATNISTLYVTQGFLVGLSFSFIYIPATLVIASWFHVRKGTAMGIAVGGVGIGGVVFSLSINELIKVTGDQR